MKEKVKQSFWMKERVKQSVLELKSEAKRFRIKEW